MLRIGFVGELGYEIHVPSMAGEHVWDEVIAAGEPHRNPSLGLEAQRILRLEKLHILVGQDTDAESDPFEVGLGWTVKADKDDFLGKRGLEGLDAAAPGERLVGFTCAGIWVPPEGASVVHDGVWVGRVTSARASAADGRYRRPGVGARRVGKRRDAVRDPVRPAPRECDRGDAALLRPRRLEAPVVNESRSAAHRSPVRTPTRAPDREAGWESVALRGPGRGTREAREGAGVADITARGKIDVRGRFEGALSGAGDVLTARIADDWAMLHRTGRRGGPAPQLGSAADAGAMVTDATHLFVGFALAGPELLEVLARLTSWGSRVARGGRGDWRADRRRSRRRGPPRPAAADAGGLRRDRVRAVRVGNRARRGSAGGRGAAGWRALRGEGWS